MRRLIPTLVLLLPGMLGAQAASYTYINQKAPFKNPYTTMLQHVNLPKVGSAFRVRVAGSWRTPNWSYRQCWLGIGVTNPGLRIDGLGGFLFTSADFLIRTPMNPKGGPMTTSTMSFSIPNSSQLIGVKFYQQVHCYVDLFGIRRHLSRGGVGVIGK